MKKLIYILLFSIAYFTNCNAQEKDTTAAVKIDSLELKEVEPFPYIAKEMIGSYDQHQTAFTALWEESVKQFLAYDEGFFAIYYNSPQEVAEDSLIWEVGTKLNEDDEIIAPLKKKFWTHKNVVRVIFEGPIGEEGKAYGKIIAWSMKNGFTISGPGLQKYLTKPKNNEKGQMIAKIEIWMPVTAKK